MKTAVIEKAYALAHPGMRVQVVWNAGTGRFEIARAWEVLEQRDMPGTGEERPEDSQ